MEFLKNQKIKYSIFTGAIILFILILGFIFRESIGISGGTEKFPISWFIIIAAILGSIVNQPFRHKEPEQTKLGGIAGYIFWKCMVSIVFAFVYVSKLQPMLSKCSRRRSKHLGRIHIVND